jgi:hypothetical protein
MLKIRATWLMTVLMVVVPTCTAWADGPRYERRWFYAMHNLQVEAEAERLVELITRAGRAGYNGVVIADYKLNILERVPEHYFRHVARVREAAAKAGVEIIPSLFPIGYSNGLLAHDPNLAEGMPVEGAPFVVRGGGLAPMVDPQARIENGGLEQTRGDVFEGFRFQDEPGRVTGADREVAHSGSVSCRITPAGTDGSSENARLVCRVAVRPRGCYRFSAWVQTRELSNTGGFRLLALGADGGRPLTFHEGGVAASQDWEQVEVVFNSQDQEVVNLYVGIWGRGSGTLWVDDLALEELALVNVLRREGCPLTVTSVDGKTRYEEERDFRPVADPSLGRVPYGGEYDFGHAGPTIRLAEGSRLREGERVKVGWYHPVITHGFQVMCCLTDAKVDELLRDQARRVNELFRPKTFFMAHDEIRVANWCQTCRATGKTPGALLADQVGRCVSILRDVNPEGEIAVWSDMFDPTHNAVKDYYLVNGSLEGSWEGLPKEVIIANWNSGRASDSLRFFEERGHRQILAGYYDDRGLGNFRRWDATAGGVRGVEGFMYTTWEKRYGLLEDYGAAMRDAK